MIITKYVEVDCNLDDFDEDEIVEYCKDLGYHVIPEEDEYKDKEIEELFTDYLTLSADMFKIQLDNFFRSYGCYK